MAVPLQLRAMAPGEATRRLGSGVPTAFLPRRESVSSRHVDYSLLFTAGRTRVLSIRPALPRLSIRAVLSDFELPADGPLEPCKPKFSRGNFESSGPSLSIPGPQSGAQPKRQRRGRKFKAATPAEAVTGALISAGCAAGLSVGVKEAAAFVSEHPVAHNLPNNLTGAVNSTIVSMVWGFGGLAVSMFAVAAIGLSLLAIQAANTPKNSTS